MDEKLIAEALKQFAEGATISELKGITHEQMEAIYGMGANLYKAGNYDDAEKIFQFLVVFDHLNPKYWTAMGALHQVRRNFEAALSAYTFAATLNIHAPKPVYYAAECYMALGKQEDALATLDALKQECPPNSEQNREYLAKGEKLRTILEKKS